MIPYVAAASAAKAWPTLVGLASAAALSGANLLLAQDSLDGVTTNAVIQGGTLSLLLGTLILFAQQIFSGKLVHRDVAHANTDLREALARATEATVESNRLAAEYAALVRALLAEGRKA